MADEVLNKEEGKKKGGMLKWIIIAVLLVALGVGGYFGYTMFFAAPPEDAASQGATDGVPQPPAADVEGKLVPLPLFLVNLSDPLGRRYLKLGVEVEVRDASARTGVEARALLHAPG